MGPVMWQMCEVDTITAPTDCIKIEYAETETETKPRLAKKNWVPNRPIYINVYYLHGIYLIYIKKSPLLLRGGKPSKTGMACGYSTLQCPTDSIRNPVIPPEWHRNGTGIRRNDRNPQEWHRNSLIPPEWHRNSTRICHKGLASSPKLT